MAPALGNRLFVDTVFDRYHAGIRWWGLPEHFGDFCVVHTAVTHTQAGAACGGKFSSGIC